MNLSSTRATLNRCYDEELDISDVIADGDVEFIIEYLQGLLSDGYKELYWDGYDSSITVIQRPQGWKAKDRYLQEILRRHL